MPQVVEAEIAHAGDAQHVLPGRIEVERDAGPTTSPQPIFTHHQVSRWVRVVSRPAYSRMYRSTISRIAISPVRTALEDAARSPPDCNCISISESLSVMTAVLPAD